MAGLIDLNGLGHFKAKENAMVADTYSASKTYAVGDYVYYNGTLYRCTTAISTTEAWTAGHWTAVKLADDCSALKTALSQITDYDNLWVSVQNFIDNVKPADDDSETTEETRSLISKVTTRVIVPDGSTWNTWSGYKNLLVRIPDGVCKVKIRGNATNTTKYCLLTSNVIQITRPSYATGYSAPISIASGKDVIFDVPNDAKFMYITYVAPTDTDVKPSDVSFLYVGSVEENSVPLVEKVVLASDYDNTIYNYIPTNRKITYTTNEYNTTWNTCSDGEKILLMPLNGVKNVSLTANSDYNTEYVFLQNKNVTIKRPDYAKWYAHPLRIPSGESVSVEVPNDAKYLYITVVRSVSGSLQDWSPSSIKLYIPDYSFNKRKPLFCFVDDDAKATALEWLEQVVDATRIPMNIALITGSVGVSTFSTWDNLRRLKNKGFVFVNHTNTTVELTTLTESQIIDSFETSQELMEQHDMPDSNILILPGGATNATVTGHIKDYFTSAWSTTPCINLPPLDTFYASRVDIDTYIDNEQAYVDKLDNWKAWVDKTIAVNGLCVFYGHAYHADYGEEKLADVIELIQYIAQKGCEIVSLPEAIRRFKNLVEGSVTVGCDGV